MQNIQKPLAVLEKERMPAFWLFTFQPFPGFVLLEACKAIAEKPNQNIICKKCNGQGAICKEAVCPQSQVPVIRNV